MSMVNVDGKEAKFIQSLFEGFEADDGEGFSLSTMNEHCQKHGIVQSYSIVLFKAAFVNVSTILLKKMYYLC